MARRNRKLSKAGPIKINLKSGWVFMDASTANGGVHHKRTEIDQHREGDGLVKVWQTEKVVDHEEMVKRVDALPKRVDYILRKHCSRVGRFYFADEAQFEKVMGDIAELKQQAALVNREASQAGCARRAHISLIPAEINLAHEAAAREVAHTIQTTLQDLLDVIQAGDIGRPFERVMLRAKNLDKLAVGICAESIKFAIEEAKDAKKAIREKLKLGQTPESAAKAADTDMLQAAIDMFAPLTKGGE